MTRSGWIVIAAGGAAAVVVGVYLATRKTAPPAIASSAPTPPAQPTPETPVPPQTRYSAPFAAATSVQLAPGDSITLTPPNPAPAGQQWLFQVNGGLTAIQWSPTNTPNPTTTYDLGTFVAQTAGTWTVSAQTFSPQYGGNAQQGSMTIVVAPAQVVQQAPVIPL